LVRVPSASVSAHAPTTATYTLSLHDALPICVTNPPATVLDGSSFSVTDSVQNIGNVTGAASTARYYLSTTTSKSGARLLIGSRADRKSTRLNSSHEWISYAVFCLKQKKQHNQ